MWQEGYRHSVAERGRRHDPDANQYDSSFEMYTKVCLTSQVFPYNIITKFILRTFRPYSAGLGSRE